MAANAEGLRQAAATRAAALRDAGAAAVEREGRMQGALREEITAAAGRQQVPP